MSEDKKLTHEEKEQVEFFGEKLSKEILSELEQSGVHTDTWHSGIILFREKSNELVFSDEHLVNFLKFKKFSLGKGEQMRIEAKSLKHVKIGCGWESKMDLDTAAVLIDSTGDVCEHVFPEEEDVDAKSKCGSLVHTGDRREGNIGKGDSESMLIYLKNVPDNIVCIFFLFVVFTKTKSFKDVENAYVRLYDVEREFEICRYDFSENKTESTCKIPCCLFRHSREEKWRLQACGVECTGVRHVLDERLTAVLQKIVKKNLPEVYEKKEKEGK